MMFIKHVLIGLIIGMATITPGVSGGIIAAALRIYEPAIYAISNLRKNFKKNVLFLLPLGIGAGAGVLLFSNIIKYLYAQWPYELLFLFFGLVAGSIPSIVHIANEKGFRFTYLWVSIITLGLVLAAAFLENRISGQGIVSGWSFINAVLYGIILAMGTIIPGISTSFILIYLGVYDDLLSAIAILDITRLIPVGLGFFIGVLPLIKIVKLLFERFRGASYYGVLGFLAGSMVTVFPGLRTGWQLMIDALLFLLGISVSSALLDLNQDKNTTLPY